MMQRVLLRFLGAILLALAAFVAAISGNAVSAQASTGCNALEKNLRSLISSSTSLNVIKLQTNAFRECMASQADSLSVGSTLTSGGMFYSIITSANTYKIFGGRDVALSAAADYRYILDGQSPYSMPTKDCSIYSKKLLAGASGDVALMSKAAQASTVCYVNSQRLPRGTISVAGLKSVGSTLNASVEGVFSNVGSTYQWYANGKSIAGATSRSLFLDKDFDGKTVRVSVTFFGKGLTSVTKSSTDFIIGVSTPVISLAPIPTISGDNKVGSSLSVVTGVWDTDASLTYQWLRNGTPISGANAQTYTISLLDSGTSVSVKVTGSKPGAISVTRTSSDISISQKNLELTPTPSLSGEARIGGILTVQTGDWDPGVTLRFQWLRNGSNIALASSSSYAIKTEDALSRISIRVTGSKPGFATVSKESSYLVVPNDSFVLAPVPLIAGEARVGNSLNVDSGKWDEGVTLKVQWLNNGSSIAGATTSSYQLAPQDVGDKISVSVTGSKPGFTSLVRISSSLTVSFGTLNPVPTPIVTGVHAVGRLLNADAGLWVTGTALSYQWLRSDLPISGATSSAYAITASDNGEKISVRVSGTKSGYLSESRSSIPQLVHSGMLVLTPIPSINGIARTGVTLNLANVVWDSGVTTSYQWIKDGNPIIGETTFEYLIKAGDVGSKIGVRVTGSKPGFDTVVRESQTLQINLGVFAASPIPSISGFVGGVAQAGRTITAKTGIWDSGVSFNYEWLRDGAPISGANSIDYTLSKEDISSRVSVRIIGTKPGYEDSVRTSQPSPIVTVLAVVPGSAPSVTGLYYIDRALTAKTSSWENGVTLAYQWLRDGKPIDGATASTYVQTIDDYKKSITVRVTGSKSGYLPASVTSYPSGVLVGLGIFFNKPSAVVSGAPRVGNSVNVGIAGAWDPGVSLSYFWMRDGIVIPNATNSTYLLIGDDHRKTISVLIIASKTNYTSMQIATDPYLVESGLIAPAPIPTVSGLAQTDEILTVNPGTWKDGVTLSYQWLRNSVAIPGATLSNYLVVPSDVGSKISVKVSANRDFYAPISQISASRTISLGIFSYSPTPTVTGSFQVGTTLTALPGDWGSNVTFSFQWLRKGLIIQGATKATYEITPNDAGYNLSVIVKASKAGYVKVENTVTTDLISGVFLAPPPIVFAGIARVGGTLTAMGGWTSGAKVTYQWFRDGVQVSGATSSKFVLKDTDYRTKISVRVTQTRFGYVPLTTASDELRILSATGRL